MQITGDYWVVENIIFTKSQKGIVLDNSNHTIIRNCEIFNTGSEAIAVRDGSSYCTIEGSYIHDTGVNTPGYGEGIYIGSAKSKTEFDFNCDYTLVRDCTFKNVAAEHIDVKEYTTGTEICGCTFYGDGMTGENYAGSFIDISGNDVYVHDNVGYRNGNEKIVAAFELHEQVEGWGYHCTFTDNTLYMDQPYGAEDTSRRMYVVDGWYSDFSVRNNQVDYGNGLVPADSWEFYNSDYVTYLD
jgi:parallel beta-helix repeat protein